MLKEMQNKMLFHDHLLKRGLTDEIRCWIDWNTERVFFPMWSPPVLVGYQRYSWNEPKIRSNAGRYFTWITEEYKPLAIWGLTELDESDRLGLRDPDLVLVCEGVWDAIRCIQCGYNAVAVLTATPAKEFVHWFRRIMQRKNLVGILDNDKNNAGLGLTKLCTSTIMCELHKDMGDHLPYEARNWLDLKLGGLL